MCELVAITTGLAIASSVAGHVGQQQAASAQAAANQQQAANAREAYIRNVNTLNERRNQEIAAGSQEITENNREALKARERVRVSAGESGVAGQSIDALLSDFYRRQFGFQDSVNQNFEGNSRAIQREAENARINMDSTVNLLPIPNRPSMFNTGLRIGTSLGEGALALEKRGYFD